MSPHAAPTRRQLLIGAAVALPLAGTSSTHAASVQQSTSENPFGPWRLAAAVNVDDPNYDRTKLYLDGTPHAGLTVGGWMQVDPFTPQFEMRRITSISGSEVTVFPELRKSHGVADPASVPVLWTDTPVWNVALFGGGISMPASANSDALHAAVADADANGGGDVVITEKGVLRWDRMLVPPVNPIRLAGLGKETVLEWAGPEEFAIHSTVNGTGFELTNLTLRSAVGGKFLQLHNFRNIVVRNVWWDGYFLKPLKFVGCEEITLERLYKNDGVWQVLRVTQQGFVSFERCRTVRFRENKIQKVFEGFDLNGDCEFVWIEENEFEDTESQAIDVNSSRHVWIRENGFRRCNYGDSANAAIYLVGYTSATPQSGVTRNVWIEENDFEDSRWADIRINPRPHVRTATQDSRVEDVWIEKNRASLTPARWGAMSWQRTSMGVFVIDQVDRLTVSENTFRHKLRAVLFTYPPVGYTPTWSASRDLTVTDNKIEDCLFESIYLDFLDAPELKGNSLRGAGRQHIVVAAACTNAKIRDGKLAEARRAALHILAGGSADVDGVTFAANATNVTNQGVLTIRNCPGYNL